MFLKARYLARIGSWTEAQEVYDNIVSKPKTVTGKKIDAHMEKAKIQLFTLDTSKLKGTLSEAKRLNDIGGDWDRRNRLKVRRDNLIIPTRHRIFPRRWTKIGRLCFISIYPPGIRGLLSNGNPRCKGSISTTA